MNVIHVLCIIIIGSININHVESLCNQEISLSEYNALYSLYNSTYGNNWCWTTDKESTIWNFTTFDLSLPCKDKWQSILCKCDKTTYIESLYLHQRCLVGNLPSNLGGLSRLQILDISNNFHLTGSIPVSILLMSNIRQIILNNNLLTSSLPNSLYTLTTLTQLSIDDNYFTGSISSNISNFINLTQFEVSNNKMTGRFPQQLFQITTLRLLFCGHNLFSGSLDINISSRSNYSLIEFELFENELTGTIPDNICHFSELSIIQLYANYFTSSIPNCMSELSRLTSLVFALNYFTSTLPYGICSSKNLTNFAISDNYFTSEICFNYIYNYTVNNYNPISRNSTPLMSLSESQSSSASAYNTVITYNGSLPYYLGKCLPHLQDLFIYNNYFNGKIPIDLSALAQLRELLIQNNKISGDILNRFNGTNQNILSDIDMSSNVLTSSIPSELFLLPQIQSIVLTSNCFTGTLPTTMCKSNGTLISLLFDGLSSNSKCPQKSQYLFKAIESMSSVFYANGVYGTIPSCIFNMPLLTTLHLSGNLLSGTLPEIFNVYNDITIKNKTNYNLFYAPIASNLSDLSLSNNRLTGTIPISFQKYNFTQQLLLSNNEFSGSLLDEFTISSTQTALSLSVNRLSGKLPTSFLQPYVSEVSLEVLSGNIFECNQNHLPANDPDSKSYSCGSENLNTALYSFGLLFVIIVVAISSIVILYLKNNQYLHEYILKVVDNLKDWLDAISISRDLSNNVKDSVIINPVQTILNQDRAANRSKESFNSVLDRSENKFYYLSFYPQILLFVDSLKWIQLITFGIVIYVMLVLMPLNLILSSSSSIYTFQYSWVISMVLQHGVSTSTVYMISIFMILLIIKLFMYGQKLKNTRWLSSLHVSRSDNTRREDISDHHYLYNTIKLVVIVILVQSINTVVTLVVNVAYVQDALRDSQLSYLDILFRRLSDYSK